MSQKKWLWYGCGGCLTILILCILAIVAGVYSCQRYVGNIQEKTELWNDQVREINQRFPFTEPKDNTYQSERFNTFLSIREKTIASTEEKLGWLIAFAQSPDDKGGFTLLQLIRKFISLPLTLFEIGITLTDHLAEAEMSLNEYRYATKLTAGEIVSWKDLEPSDALYPLAEQYLKPLEDINEKIEEAKRANPQNNIDPGPFDLDRFLEKIPDKEALHQDTRNMIREHNDRLVPTETTCLIDAIAVGF